MPRHSRQTSYSGFFHVIARGIGKQILFEDKADYLYFLSLLQKNAINIPVTICSYCLMDNHVHLLLLDQEQNLSLFMKKIGISYALYYNHKYQRTGHVFQDRYKSEAIETYAYLLTVFRYILKNPEKAGICAAENYQWNSYHCYLDKNSFVDTDPISAMIGDSDQYRQFMSEDDTNAVLEYESVRMTDNNAIQIIRSIGLQSGTEVQSFDKEKRNSIIKELLSSGLSVRQIERLTGIGRGVVQRLTKK